jgi:hypothetical protein
MEWYWWALILFFVGVLEHTLSEYQNLLSVRLKVGQTVFFAEINLMLDFVVSVIWFILLMDFWKALEAGVMAWMKLAPYLVYIQGCVLGTAFALLHYRRKKRKMEHQKRLQHLEKARQIKKQLQALEDDLSIEEEIETEAEFDDNDQESKDAEKEVHSETKSDGQSTTQEKHNENPPQ